MKNQAIVVAIGFIVACFAFGLLLNHYFFCKNFVANRKPFIVTTTGMIADLVREVVADEAQVVALMGPGIDPHMYRARAGDIDRLNGASLIVYNGIHLEGKMAELFSHMSSFKKVISLEQLIEKEKLLPIEGTDLFDPHIWHDVSLWASLVNPLMRVLKEAGFDDSEMKVRASNYEKKLFELHESILDAFQAIASDKKILVTAHDAFRYFGAAYGIMVCGLQGVSTNAQAGLFDVQRLARFIGDKRVKTIFVESCVSDAGIKLLQEAVVAAGWNVSIGQELYADALGDAGHGADTYISMIQSNVRNLLVAFKD